MENYYKILEVEITATQEQIKSQYHLLLHAWHSDKFPNKEQKKKAEEHTRKIIEAYSILGNFHKRKIYDEEFYASIHSQNLPPASVNPNSSFIEDKSMLAIIIEIAKSIVTALIIDFIRENRKGADKKQLEQQVLSEVVKRVDRNSKDIKQISRDVMDEVEILSARTPMLRVTPSSIELAQPIKKPFFRKDNTNALLAERLQEFENVVLLRRQQLGLPTEPIKTETKSSPAESLKSDIPEGWEKVKEDEKEDSVWGKEILDMQDRIRERRQKNSKGN